MHLYKKVMLLSLFSYQYIDVVSSTGFGDWNAS